MERIELPSAVLETVVLPLNYIPVWGERPELHWNSRSHNPGCWLLHYVLHVALRAGFEPAVPCRTSVFKTDGISHSPIEAFMVVFPRLALGRTEFQSAALLLS